MRLKMFTFFVRNDVTKEIATFTGQGVDLEGACKDAMATITTVINPSQSGVQNEKTNYLPTLNVTTEAGEKVSRSKKDFEGEEAYKA